MPSPRGFAGFVAECPFHEGLRLLLGRGGVRRQCGGGGRRLAASGERPQRPDHVARRLVAVLRPLGHHLLDDRHQPGGSVRPQRRQRRRRVGRVVHELVDDRAAGERDAAGQQVVQGAAQAVDVGPDVDLAAGVLGLLRGDVVRRCP